MMRFGFISALQPDTGKARVRFPEDGIVSDWLPLIQPKTKGDKYYYMPDEGEHVACMMDEHLESGVILGAIYSKANTPGAHQGKDIFSIEFSDGTFIKYDRGEGKLTLNCVGKIEIETPDAEIKGPLKVTGNITANGEVIARAASLSISLSTHNHPTAPTGPVSPPTPGT